MQNGPAREILSALGVSKVSEYSAILSAAKARAGMAAVAEDFPFI
jgi:hypothetical protein